MLKTDFKSDIFEGNRQYKMVQNANNTISLENVTEYTQEGDIFTHEHINATNEVVNNLNEVELPELKKSVSDGKTLLAAAITAKRVAAAATDTFAQLAAKIGQIVLGSGNATPPDVADGKTFTNSSGVEQTGTMPNRGNVSYSLPINGSYTIEAGQHGGGGRVTQNIPVLGAQTLYPGTTAKTASVAGNYMTGNISVPAVTIAPAYIKKGQVITFPDGSTVTGTWEGYVPTVSDIYNNGTFRLDPIFGTAFGTSIILEAGMIRIGSYITSPSNLAAIGFVTDRFNLSGFTRINIELDTSLGILAGNPILVFYYTDSKSLTSARTQIATMNYDTSSGGRRTIYASFSGVNVNNYLVIGIGNMNAGVRIYRIWLS